MDAKPAGAHLFGLEQTAFKELTILVKFHKKRTMSFDKSLSKKSFVAMGIAVLLVIITPNPCHASFLKKCAALLLRQKQSNREIDHAPNRQMLIERKSFESYLDGMDERSFAASWSLPMPFPEIWLGFEAEHDRVLSLLAKNLSKKLGVLLADLPRLFSEEAKISSEKWLKEAAETALLYVRCENPDNYLSWFKFREKLKISIHSSSIRSLDALRAQAEKNADKLTKPQRKRLDEILTPANLNAVGHDVFTAVRINLLTPSMQKVPLRISLRTAFHLEEDGSIQLLPLDVAMEISALDLKYPYQTSSIHIGQEDGPRGPIEPVQSRESTAVAKITESALALTLRELE